MLAICEGEGPHRRHDPVAYEQAKPDESCPVCKIIDDAGDKQGDINEMAAGLDTILGKMREVIRERRVVVGEGADIRYTVVLSTDEIDGWMDEIEGVHSDLENFTIED